jgi:hypothetical protein
MVWGLGSFYMKDLCETCSKANNGCPIYPTLKITIKCIEYKKKKNDVKKLLTILK